MQNLLLDLRHALSRLRRSPGFTIMAILTFALGIGATTTIFSVVNSVILMPLAYRDSSQLVVAWERVSYLEHLFPFVGANPRHEQMWQKQATDFEDLTLLQQREDGSSLGVDHPRLVGHLIAQPNLLAMLGVRPILGRDFLPEETTSGHQNVVIISWKLWHSLFNGDENVIGKMLKVAGTPRQVIGVLPEGFDFSNSISYAPEK
jgi:hypothetical protein